MVIVTFGGGTATLSDPTRPHVPIADQTPVRHRPRKVETNTTDSPTSTYAYAVSVSVNHVNVKSIPWSGQKATNMSDCLPASLSHLTSDLSDIDLGFRFLHPTRPIISLLAAHPD